LSYDELAKHAAQGWMLLRLCAKECEWLRGHLNLRDEMIELSSEIENVAEQQRVFDDIAKSAITEFDRKSWPRLFGQNFDGDKWSPAWVALSTVTGAEGPYKTVGRRRGG